jgi:predicted glycosyltransferase
MAGALVLRLQGEHQATCIALRNKPSGGEAVKALLYVQHLLGIGHLARTSRIARKLAGNSFSVTMVSGGEAVAGFPGSGINLIQLPPIKSRDQAFSALVDPSGREIDENYRSSRRQRLLAALDRVKPDVLILEAFPFGRRQMRFELLPLLAAAKALNPPPLVVSSIRDILQENKKPGRAEETAELVRQYFDIVLVHGDPYFAKLEETFPLTHLISDRIFYTGLVAAERPQPSTDRYDVVVSAGGGAAGGALVDAAIRIARDSHDMRWCIITGPNLAPSGDTGTVDLFRFRADFPNLLINARVSVSQAGYNTVCDILNAGCGAVLIPFAQGGETEQSLRAAKLKSLGLAEVIDETELDPERLKAAVSLAAARPRSAPGLNLAGAQRTADVLKEKLALRSGRSA